MVQLKLLLNEEVSEQGTQVRVIRLLVESQPSGVVQKLGELPGKALTELLYRRLHLHFVVHVLMLLGIRKSLATFALPRQIPSQEVHKNVTQRLDIITPAVFNAAVLIAARVPRRAGETLPVTPRDVSARGRVDVLLRQAKINNKHLISLAPATHKKVVRLQVTVHKPLRVHILNPVYHLVPQHNHRLERKSLPTDVKQVQQTGAEKIQDHHIVVLLLTIPSQIGHALTTSQDVVEAALMHELRVLRARILELNAHDVVIREVRALIHLAKSAAADHTFQRILVGDRVQAPTIGATRQTLHRHITQRSRQRSDISLKRSLQSFQH